MVSPLVKERLVNDWYRITTNEVTRATAIAQSTDSSLIQACAAQTQPAPEQSTALQNPIGGMLVAVYEFEIFERLLDRRQHYLQVRDHMNDLELAGNERDAQRVFNSDFTPAAHQYQSTLNELLVSQQTYMDRVSATLIQTSKQSQIILLGSSLLIVILCAFFAWRLTRGITVPLSTAVSAAQRIAKGDLSGHIVANSKDETGELLSALADMNHNLNRLVGNVRNGAESIATASSQIAAGNTDLSSRTEEQAASLTETASAMEELTNTVRQTADNARQANQLALNSSSIANQGGEATEQVTHTMSSISDSAAKIVNIISVIDGIAFQTNILALNAAVGSRSCGGTR